MFGDCYIEEEKGKVEGAGEVFLSACCIVYCIYINIYLTIVLTDECSTVHLGGPAFGKDFFSFSSVKLFFSRNC